MNSKGQIGNVLYGIFFIFTVGFILVQFLPILNEVRVETLNDLDESQVLARIGLYALIPIIWTLYALLSIILVFISIKTSAGGL